MFWWIVLSINHIANYIFCFSADATQPRKLEKNIKLLIDLDSFKDGAYKLKILFPWCVIMQEMHILTSPIEIQKENWG